MRRSLDDLLNDEAVELVIVNTPRYTHFELAKKSLKAGKHVVVEKPFTATGKEAEELVSLAEQKGKKLTVFQNRASDSDYKTVKKIFGEGWLGPIVEAEFHYDRCVSVLSPKQHMNGRTGQESVYDLGPHLIDQALQLGMPEALFADLGITRPGSRVEDYKGDPFLLSRSEGPDKSGLFCPGNAAILYPAWERAAHFSRKTRPTGEGTAGGQSPRRKGLGMGTRQ